MTVIGLAPPICVQHAIYTQHICNVYAHTHTHTCARTRTPPACMHRTHAPHTRTNSFTQAHMHACTHARMHACTHADLTLDVEDM